MSVTVTLRQEKITLSDKFVAISQITAANPDGYYPVFVVSENIGDPIDERFDRVATLNDLTTYSENPLNVIFSTGAFSGIGAIPGDVLEITNAPDYWQSILLPVAKFFVTDIDPSGDFLVIDWFVQPFPTALGACSWTLRNATETIVRGSGTNARCIREDRTGDTTYLRRHLTRVFTEVKAAANHDKAVLAFVQALIDDANEDANQFSGVVTEVIS